MVAPKRVAEHVWVEEAAKWRPDLTCRVAAGTPAKRREALESSADIVAIGRDNLADALATARFKTLIIDELSGFKTANTKRFKTARQLIKYVEYVWGLTGTPAPSGLEDLWAQVYLLDGGKRLGRTITAYRQRYFRDVNRLPSGVVTKRELLPGAAKSIYRKIEDICMSMSTAEAGIDLPPVTYSHIKVDLPPKVRRVYETLKRDLVADLEVIGVGDDVFTAANAAALSSKLSQVAAGFLYGDTPGVVTELHKAKVSALCEIVEGTGSPVLVFYRYKAEAKMIRQALSKITEVHDVDEPGVIEAWNRREVPVMLAHPASAGHGLNLQHGGNVVVWTSLQWSLELYQQANKRLARSGQKSPVVIHHIDAVGTVDSAIHRRLAGHDSVQAALLDHLKTDI